MSQPAHIKFPELETPKFAVSSKLPVDVALAIAIEKGGCLKKSFKVIIYLFAFILFQTLYTYGLFAVFYKPTTSVTTASSLVKNDNQPQRTDPSKFSSKNSTGLNITNNTSSTTEYLPPQTNSSEATLPPQIDTSERESDRTGTPNVVVNLTNSVTSNQLNWSKVAAIVDTRDVPELVPLILHFLGVVGDDWPFKVFYSQENLHLFKNSASIQKYVKSGRMELIPLDIGTRFTSRYDVSSFLTSRWIWEKLAPASFILFFQLDSIICGNSNLKVEDFIKYDMMGAPWPAGWGGGGSWGANGGLSIRRREKILEILDKWEWNREPEDVFYYKRLQELPNPNLANGDVSVTFSVEQLWYPSPLGYHQPKQKWGNRAGALKDWCPEYQLIRETGHFR